MSLYCMHAFSQEQEKRKSVYSCISARMQAFKGATTLQYSLARDHPMEHECWARCWRRG